MSKYQDNYLEIRWDSKNVIVRGFDDFFELAKEWEKEWHSSQFNMLFDLWFMEWVDKAGIPLIYTDNIDSFLDLDINDYWASTKLENVPGFFIGEEVLNNSLQRRYKPSAVYPINEPLLSYLLTTDGIITVENIMDENGRWLIDLEEQINKAYDIVSDALNYCDYGTIEYSNLDLIVEGDTIVQNGTCSVEIQTGEFLLNEFALNIEATLEVRIDLYDLQDVSIDLKFNALHVGCQRLTNYKVEQGDYYISYDGRDWE